MIHFAFAMLSGVTAQVIMILFLLVNKFELY